MPTRPSAASRYTSWQTPEQKSPREDPNAAARAWERMRPGSSRQSHHAPASSASASNTGSRRAPTRPMDPPPPPPRTEAQRKKAEASFGTRRTNFTQSVPDEPPAASSSYTTRRPNVFSQAAEAAKQTNTESDYVDPLSKQFQETFVDGRQRTPYSAHSGEKFNPFDGTNINRGRSVRDNLRAGSVSGNSSRPPSPPTRRRSASVPDEAETVSPPGRSRAGHRYTPPDQARPSGLFAGLKIPDPSADKSNRKSSLQCCCESRANKVVTQRSGMEVRKAKKALQCMVSCPLPQSHILLRCGNWIHQRPITQRSLPQCRTPDMLQTGEDIINIVIHTEAYRACSRGSIPVAQRKQVPETPSRTRPSNIANYKNSLTTKRDAINLPSLRQIRHLENHLQQRSVLTSVRHIASICPSTTTRSHPRANNSDSCGRVPIASTLGLLLRTFLPMIGSSMLEGLMKMHSLRLRREHREPRAAGHSLLGRMD